MSWRTLVRADPLPWLLDPAEPGPRYLALRDVVGVPADDPELRSARTEAHRRGPIADVLAAMAPDGYWLTEGPGYNPKYRATIWSLTLLAQLGARIEEDARVATACAYVLEHSIAAGGRVTMSGAPSGTIDCLQGNVCWALRELGCDDPRLEPAFDWLARSVTGEGVAPASEKDAPLRYYSTKCGPNFACVANANLPCAWGAVKVVLALAKVPAERRTPLVDRAIEKGVGFLLGIDPATGEYPRGSADRPSRNWWKLGFPVFYITDVLQVVEALGALGRGGDVRLAAARDLIAGKQDDQGRWPLEYDYAGKTWGEFGAKKQANKWVTIRALRALGREG